MEPSPDTQSGPDSDTNSRIFARLGELPAQLFPPSFIDSVALVEAYGQAWAEELARQLGIEPSRLATLDTRELAEQLGFVGSSRFALDWMLASLRARQHTPQPLPSLAELRARILALDAANAPTLDLLDAAAAAFTPVVRGERKGAELLLGPAGTALWSRYFANDNPLYAINNQIGALAAAHRLPASGPFSILEVGAGGGSGAEALLAELDRRGTLERLQRYSVTEPSPFFRRRSQRSLSTAWPALPLAFGDLDIDRPWPEQGVAAGSIELVYAVNVVHVAVDLAAALAAAHAALAPGGWLVAVECLRPFPGQAIAVELVFGLLESFTAVRLDGERRPNPGFLTPEQWERAITAAGFAHVEVVPDVAAIRELTPHFLTGAVCGKKAG